MKLFSVVHFKNDNTVEPVPSSWVSDDKSQCYWPKKTPKKCDLQNADCLPEPDWTLLEIKFIKSYGTYEKASEKANKYRYDSDVETSEGERLRRKTSLSPDKIGTAALLPPSGNIHLGLHQYSQQPLSLSTPVSSTSQAGITTRSQRQLFSTDDSNLFENSAYQEELNCNPSQEAGGYTILNPECIVVATQADVNNLQQELRDFQIVTIKKLEDLKQDLSGIRELLQAVLSSESGLQKTTPTRIFQLIPVTSLEVLKELESELSNAEAYNDLVSMFAKIGGPTTTQHVYNVLKHTFSRTLSTQIRLTSTSGKFALKNSVVAKAIRESIHRGNRLGSTTDDTKINSDIGKWFRNQGYSNNEKKGPHDPTQHEKQEDPTGSDHSSESDSEKESSSHSNAVVIEPSE